MRVRGCIGGALFLAIGCFLLLIAVFMSVLVASKHTALTQLTDKDVAALLLLYGLGAVFVIGGISIMIGGGRWFIRSIIAFATRGRRYK
jgi:Ca2+/Na+ antiporter